MTKPEKRTPARPGKYDRWPDGSVVEYGPRRATMFSDREPESACYDVYVDGVKIGSVASMRMTTSVSVGKGSRLRRDLGRPLIWRYAFGDADPLSVSRLRCSTRAQATASLVNDHLRSSSEQ